MPGLTLLAGLPIQDAIGTSLWVIAMNSASGLLAHVQAGGLPAGLTAAFTAAVAGALAGVRLARARPGPVAAGVRGVRDRRGLRPAPGNLGLRRTQPRAIRSRSGNALPGALGQPRHRPQDLALAARAHHAGDLLAALEHDQRRDSLDAQA